MFKFSLSAHFVYIGVNHSNTFFFKFSFNSVKKNVTGEDGPSGLVVLHLTI